MRSLFIILFIYLSICPSWANTKISISGVEKVADTLAYRQIGPGIMYSKIILPEYPLSFYMLTVDLTNDYNKIETFQAQNTVKKTEAMTKAYSRLNTTEKRTLAGVNANFWIVSGQGQDDLIGVPHSGSICDGAIITDPNAWNRGHGAIGFATIDEGQNMHIDDMEFDGIVTIGNSNSFSISEVNRKRKTNEIAFFNQYIGSITNTDDTGVEVFIKPIDGQSWGINKDVECEVTRIVVDKGGNTLQEGESVLSGNGTGRVFLEQLSVGQKIKVNMGVKLLNSTLRPHITQMVTGNALVLKDGVLTDRNYNEAYNTTLYPRTGIGMSQDGKTAYLIVIDKMGTSIGASTETMCQILKNVGAWNVTTMDGGGSAQMMLGGNIINRPSDGRERPVANGWFLFSTAPIDQTITRIEFAEYDMTTPMFASVKPKFLAYNQYGELINEDLVGVTIDCDQSFGVISDDKTTFTASKKTGVGVLTADYNGIKANKKVTIQNSSLQIKLQSVLIDDVRFYPIEVLAKSENNNYPVNPSSLTWTIADPLVCKIENGILTGLSNGNTTITGTLGDFSQTMNVTVEISDKMYYIQEDFNDLSSFKNIKPSSTLKNFTTVKDRDGNLKVSYTYTANTYSTIDFEKAIQAYSLPDTIIVSLNTGNVPFTKVSISLSQNNSTTKKIFNLDNPSVGEDVQLKVVVRDLLTDPDDISLYPVKINKVLFYPADLKHIVNQDYAFYIKDIKLAFAGKSTVGIKDEMLDKSTSNLSVYPNPVKRGEFINVRIQHQVDISTVMISIYSLSGELVYSAKINTDSDVISIPIHHLSVGNYILQLQSGLTSNAIQFIVK